MKKTLAFVILLIVAAMSLFGFRRYEHHRFIASLVPHVKNASLRVANSARYESEEGSKITYLELFQKLATDVEEIDKRLIEIQALSSERTSEITDPTVKYLQACQEYLRAIAQKYRKALAYSTAMDRAKERLADYTRSSHYSADYEKRRADAALAELDTAKLEYDASLPELSKAASALEVARGGVSDVFESDALVPVPQLDAVILKNPVK